MSESGEVAGVEISKPDKALFPDGITKLGLAEYYAAVADVMVPHLADRPVSMQRFPDGIAGEGFYEKKVPAHFPEWVSRVELRTSNGSQEQAMVNDARSLVYLADQACITPHSWLSCQGSLDQPDQMIIDLDPSGDGVDEVRRATRMTGELLDDLGLTSFVKSTGSRGYHVHVPLLPERNYDAVRDLAFDLARQLVDRAPDLLTVEQRKVNRGDRVFVDVLRNGYGQTAVPPYAVRARRRAPVATPLTWDEIGRVDPDHYDVASVRRRLAQRADPWAGMRGHAQGLDQVREKLANLV